MKLTEQNYRAELGKRGIALSADNTVRMRVSMKLAPRLQAQVSARSAQLAESGPAANVPADSAGMDGVPVTAQPSSPFAPRPEDYIIVAFRALSMVSFKHWGDQLDFSRPGVLEAAVPLLSGKKVYKDHYVECDNWAGAVARSWWGASDPGLSAAGIDVDLKIDAQANPKTARGLLSDPPMIDSVSLGMCFAFEASHPDLEPWTFWELQGDEVNGEVVRVIVSQILEVTELSLVWAGADDQAKRLAAEPPPNNQDVVSPATFATSGGSARVSEKEVEMKLDTARAQALLGKAPATEPDAVIEQLLAHGEGLSRKVTEMETIVSGLRPRAEAGDAILAAERTEVIRLMKLSQGADASAATPVAVTALEASINSSPAEQLTALHQEFQAAADKKFPAKCAACGGTNIERRSSLEQQPAGEPAKPASVDRAADRIWPVGK